MDVDLKGVAEILAEGRLPTTTPKVKVTALARDWLLLNEIAAIADDFCSGPLAPPGEARLAQNLLSRAIEARRRSQSEIK